MLDLEIDWERIYPDSTDEETEFSEIVFMDDYRDDSYTRQLPRRARSYDKLIAFITPGVRFSVRRTYHYELLKSTLVRHFYHHYRAGLVMWPTISDVVFMYRLRVPRFSKETPEDLVLYAQPSHFRQGKDGLTIGEGLFSWTSYTHFLY